MHAYIHTHLFTDDNNVEGVVCVCFYVMSVSMLLDTLKDLKRQERERRQEIDGTRSIEETNTHTHTQTDKEDKARHKMHAHTHSRFWP